MELAGPALANARCSAALVQALVQDLPAARLLQVVLSPGSRSTPLVLALAAHPRVRLHVVLDERAAAFVALGLAQASGCTVATLCTSGSATAHALPAVMEAHHAGVPLLLLTADRPGEAQGVGAAQTTAQQGLFAAHVRRCQHLPEPLAEPAAALGTKGDAAAAAQVLAAWQTAGVRAMAACAGPLPGPVHLNLPFREPLGTQGLAPQAWLPPRLPPHYFPAVPDALGAAAKKALAAFLAAPGPGVLVCGAALPAGPTQAAWGAAVRALGGRLGWPVLAEGLSGVRFGAQAAEDPRLCPPADGLLAAPNLPAPLRILQLGAAPLSRSTQRLLQQAQALCVLAPPGSWPDPNHQAQLVLEGEPLALAEAAHALAPPAADAPQQAFTAVWQAAAAAARASMQATARAPLAWFEGTALQATLAALPAQAQLVVGNSLAVRDLDNACGQAVQITALHGRRGVSGIDGALSHLLGVGLTDPQRPCVGAFGDLTFLHDVGALRLCAAAAAQLTAVVFNNGGGEIFAQLPIAANAQAFAPYFLTRQDQQLEPLCKATGTTYRQVEDFAQLDAAVRAATAPGRAAGLWLIEATFVAESARAHRRAARAHCLAAVAASLPGAAAPP